MSAHKLYVSDLDGTLLRNDGTLSEFSREQLTRLLDEGLPFTVASARAVSSMQGVLPDLPIRLPVISANGAVLAHLGTGERVTVHALDSRVLHPLYRFVLKRGHVPFVAALAGAHERLYYSQLANDGMRRYMDLKTFSHDQRVRRVDDLAACLDGDVVALALCDRREPLEDMAGAVAERFPDTVATNFYEDGYAPGWFWLAMQSPQATKDRAVAELADRLGVALDDLAVFGDHWNDIPMFGLAGAAIAVANAADELKAHATTVIGPNEDDSVVKYILHDWQ